MEKEYDLSKMKKRKNPYAQKLKKQITIKKYLLNGLLRIAI